MGSRSERRALLLAAVGAAALSTAPARADSKDKVLDPSLYVDPAYNPDHHGGLPYAKYLRMSRGKFRRSTGMMVTGIVLVGAGSTVMGVGTGVYAAAHGCSHDAVPNFEGPGGLGATTCVSRTGEVSGLAILIAGTIVAGLGIPLWIAGASEVPWAESATHDRASTSARLVPAITPAAAGNGLALKWQF